MKLVMKDILSSAAKLVFILLAIAASIGFFSGILSEDSFMILAVSAFSFFFSFKGNNEEPYAGK